MGRISLRHAYEYLWRVGIEKKWLKLFKILENPTSKWKWLYAFASQYPYDKDPTFSQFPYEKKPNFSPFYEKHSRMDVVFFSQAKVGHFLFMPWKRTHNLTAARYLEVYHYDKVCSRGILCRLIWLPKEFAQANSKWYLAFKYALRTGSNPKTSLHLRDRVWGTRSNKHSQTQQYLIYTNQ